MALAVNSESNADLVNTIHAIKQNLLEVDRWLTSCKLALENDEWSEARLGIGRCRMRLVESIQKIDKLSNNISNVERVESIGYRPEKTQGGDVKKSAANNLISDILEGRVNARQAAARLKK
jgi:hypothetical protein